MVPLRLLPKHVAAILDARSMEELTSVEAASGLMVGDVLASHLEEWLDKWDCYAAAAPPGETMDEHSSEEEIERPSKRKKLSETQEVFME